MDTTTQQELIEYHEYTLEDIHEGLIALDNVLKLLTQEVHGQPLVLPLSRGQVIGIALHLSGRISYDFEDLDSVKSHLPPDAAAKLDQLSERFQKQWQRVRNLKLFGTTSVAMTSRPVARGSNERPAKRAATPRLTHDVTPPPPTDPTLLQTAPDS